MKPNVIGGTWQQGRHAVEFHIAVKTACTAC